MLLFSGSSLPWIRLAARAASRVSVLVQWHVNSSSSKVRNLIMRMFPYPGCQKKHRRSHRCYQIDRRHRTNSRCLHARIRSRASRCRRLSNHHLRWNDQTAPFFELRHCRLCRRSLLSESSQSVGEVTVSENFASYNASNWDIPQQKVISQVGRSSVPSCACVTALASPQRTPILMQLICSLVTPVSTGACARLSLLVALRSVDANAHAFKSVWRVICLMCSPAAIWVQIARSCCNFTA